jgi:hypothetical protein
VTITLKTQNLSITFNVKVKPFLALDREGLTAQGPMWSYQVNLDKRVRDDHPLQRINRVLDLGFVRRQVAHTYGRCGNKSVPPAVILRMMLLLFLDDIRGYWAPILDIMVLSILTGGVEQRQS